MKMNLIGASLLLLPVFSFAQTAYIVRAGDTVLKIADKNLGIKDRKDPRRYEYANQIRKLNPKIKNLNSLSPLQSLIIPEKNDSAQAVSSHAHHETAQEPASQEPALQPTPSPIHEAESHAEAAPSPQLPPLAETADSADRAAEAPQIAAPAHEEKHHPNFVFIQPRYQLVHLDVEDLAAHSKASLGAKSSVRLDLQYGKIINERFHLLFQAGITQTEFKDIEGTATSINHKSELSKHFGVGLAYEATHSLHLDFMMLYADRTFLIPGTAGAYKLESIGIPAAELNISWDLYSGSTNVFGMSAIAEYLGTVVKDEIEYKSALEPFGALYWKSNLGHDRTNYKVTLTYKHGHQKTSVTEQKEELTALGVGFFF